MKRLYPWVGYLFVFSLTILIGFVMVSYSYAQSEFSPNQIREVAWNPNGEQIAVGYQNGQIELISAESLSPTMTFHADMSAVISLAWSPNGRFLASGSLSPDSTLRIWDTLLGEQHATFSDFGVDILTVGWNLSGTQVIAISAERLTNDGNAIAVDLQTHDVQFLSLGAALDIRWSPNGDRFAVARLRGISIYDANTFQMLAEYQIDRTIRRPGFIDQLGTIRWHPNGTLIAGGMTNGIIILWDAETLEPLTMMSGNEYQGDNIYLARITELHFDTITQTLTSVSGDGTIHTWDLNNHTLIESTTVNPNYAAQFSPYGARLALGIAPALNTSLSHPIQIIIPDPSLDRLQSIAELCGAPLDLQSEALETIISHVETLDIPPACRADLLAVAHALQEQS